MPTPPAGSMGSTRQQLDDLDQLLQRMLSLPLSQLDDGFSGAASPPPPLLPPQPQPQVPMRPTVATIPTSSPRPNYPPQTHQQPMMSPPPMLPPLLPPPPVQYAPPVISYGPPPAPMPQPIPQLQVPPPSALIAPPQMQPQYAPQPQPQYAPQVPPQPQYAPQVPPQPQYAPQVPPQPQYAPQPQPQYAPPPQVVAQPPMMPLQPQAQASTRPLPQPTALDSSWRVELPTGATQPAPQQTVFAAWTAEHALPGSVSFPGGPPKRQTRGPVRLNEMDEDLPSESKIIRFDSTLGDPPAPPRLDAIPTPMPQPQAQPGHAPQTYTFGGGGSPAHSPAYVSTHDELGVQPSPSPQPAYPTLPEVGSSLPMHEAMPTSLPKLAPTPVSTIAAPRESVPVLLWPMAVCNWMLEGSLNLFGPPGRMLTSTSGKTLLGWTGILMFLVAIGLGAAEWFGFDWTW